MKHIFLILALQAGLQSLGQSVIATMQHPEAIVSDGKQLFVGNFGAELKPLAVDSDGYVARLDFDGNVLQERFIQGLNAPKGMCILDGVLYLTDINKVLGFRLSDAVEVFRVELPNAQFLNDITSKDSQTLYITDSQTRTIYQIDVPTASFQIFDQGQTSGFTNGIFYCPAEKRLYVVAGTNPTGPGQIGYYPEGSTQFVVLSQREGSYDGIASLDADYLLVSDWQNSRDNGTLLKVHRQTGECTAYPHIQKLAGSADFYFHPPTRQVYIPCLVGSQIVKAGL